MRKFAKIGLAFGLLVSVVIINGIIFLQDCTDRIRGLGCKPEIAQWVDLTALVLVSIYIFSVVRRRNAT